MARDECAVCGASVVIIRPVESEGVPLFGGACFDGV